VTTPFAWLAQRVTLGPRALRWGTTAALVVSILIVLGGGVVRVTGSGLGCPTWPACNATEVIAPISDNIHQVIEQANRLLTTVLIVAVGWAIVAARLQEHRDRMLTRLAWSMFWLVVVNAVAGGITVLVQLNPWVVALHFVLAMALLATAALTWHRARWRGEVGAGAARTPAVLARALLVGTAVLVVVGTLVSGSGPHSGDTAAVPRMGLDWTEVVLIHAALAGIVIVLTIALFVALRVSQGGELARRTTLTLLVVLLAQGAIGGVQSLIGIPAVLVALHLLGAALSWVGAIRVLLDVDPGVFALRALPESSAAVKQPL
jgi:cytochrome c oxidase assembly protein subunit 15